MAFSCRSEAHSSHPFSIRFGRRRTGVEAKARLRSRLTLVFSPFFNFGQRFNAVFPACIEPPHKTNLFEVSPWYREHFFLDLENLHNWGRVDELRLVTNTVKHAEINQTDRLRKLRPDLFRNPAYAEFEDLATREIELPQTPVFQPLAGTDLFVSEGILQTYCQAVEAFFEEVAEYFDAHGDQYFPR